MSNLIGIIYFEQLNNQSHIFHNLCNLTKKIMSATELRGLPTKLT